MTTTLNPLPTFSHPTEPDRWAKLPLHVFNTETHTCDYCGEPSSNWELTYEEYVSLWFATEYEGEPGHTPLPEEDYNYLRNTCMMGGDSILD